MRKIGRMLSSGEISRVAALRRLVSEFDTFSRVCYPEKRLRNYQLEAAGPVLEAIRQGVGGGYTLIFSRQAGKDELLAQVEAFLLVRYRIRGGNIVVGAPTFKPQCLVSKRRLLDRCGTAFHEGVVSTQGYRVECGKAGVSFLSTEPTANVRGETADVLLVANEAQDILTERWDAVFAPMAASTNAPMGYSGTPWTSGSLLSRQRGIGRREGRLFEADWVRVAEEVPLYGEHVRQRMAQLGEKHPFIRSEYCLQELGSEGGLFPERVRVQMKGSHKRRTEGEAGKVYALLVDVAGEAEDAPEAVNVLEREKRRDSTALTVVEVDLEGVKDPLVARPLYRVVDRREWVGKKHTQLYSTLIDLATNVWKARYVVVDATGIGAGLASFLGERLRRGRSEVIPFVFSLKSKSDLGWGFMGCIESGRYKEYVEDGVEDTGRFWAQVEGCEYTVDAGPGKIMRWSVAERKGHDDLLVSAALVAHLDTLDWRPRVAVGRTREDFT
jgi:hypothetical protein